MGNVNIINSGLSEKVSESQSDTGKIQNAGALMKTSVRQTHPHILSVKKKNLEQNLETVLIIRTTLL